MTWNNNTLKDLGIKGPRPLPIIGSMADIFRKGIIGVDLYWMQKYGKVFGVMLGRYPSLVIADPEIVKDITIKYFDNFPNHIPHMSNDFIMGKMLNNLSDDHWRNVRNLLSPIFTARKLRGMHVLLKRCCDKMVKNLMSKAEKDEIIEFRDYTGAYIMDSHAGVGFGLEIESESDTNNNTFVKIFKKLLNIGLSSPKMMLLIFLPHLYFFLCRFKLLTFFSSDCLELFSKEMARIIRHKKEMKQKDPDFLSLLIDNCLEESIKFPQEETADVNGGIQQTADVKGEKQNEEKYSQERTGLTHEEVMAQSLLFLLTGLETTAGTLSFVAYCLAVNPECQETLIAEIDAVLEGKEPSYDMLKKLPYLEMCLSETLRIYPPLPRGDRICKKDTTINGLFIPKDMVVYIPIHALHNDPDVWPDPEQFRPERFLEEERDKRHQFQWIPFGMGPRHCIGMRFALMEIKMTLVYILQNFRFRTCEKTQIPIKLNKLRMIGENGMYLKLEKRSSRD